MVDRKQAREKAEKESARADLKQHADKIIQGFEKLNEGDAKRAVWELFQNAVDLDATEISIENCKGEFIFVHNGKPFTSNTLICLIKQVSSDSASDENTTQDEIGQFGTGFITTHSFGKKILLSGCIKDIDYFIPINNFEIDRIAADSDVLIDKLIAQEQAVFNLVEKGEYSKIKITQTKFAFQATTVLEKQNIDGTISQSEIFLPYVLLLNPTLETIFVKSNGISKTFKKGKADLKEGIHIREIFINGDRTEIFYLASEDNNLIVILPLRNGDEVVDISENISKLFLFYPLIGTENLGINYIIHSKSFFPTEPRDNIYLKSTNDQIKEKEKSNREQIESASKMILDFVKDNSAALKNSIKLSSVGFNTLTENGELNGYLKELKKTWVDAFKSSHLVETSDGQITPVNAYFFSDELLLEESFFDAIYNISKLFWKDIPKREIAIEWTKIINHWEDSSLNKISLSDIVLKIESAGSLDFFTNHNDLLDFYKYLVKEGRGEIFNHNKLLPNIKNEFRLLTSLNSTINIDDVLIEVADILVPDVPKRYINPQFNLDFGLEPYDRKKFSKEVNGEIAELAKSLKQNNLLPTEKLSALIRYCSLFASLTKMGVRGKLMPHICKYYQKDFTPVHFPNPNEEIEFLTSIRCLLRNFLLDLGKKESDWIQENISFIKDVLEPIHDYYEFDDIVQSLPIFPNQEFHLCKQGELKIDDGIPEELKNIYDNVLRPAKKIRGTLIISSLSKYLKSGEERTSKNVADYIDKVFREKKSYDSINEHPFKNEILQIVKAITDDKNWANYFPLINEKRAVILMQAIIEDESTKDDLFSIIGLDKTKIALLGDLSKHSDLELIIKLGKEAVEEKKQSDANFQFKHQIGKHIETLILNKIKADVNKFSIEVIEQQNGQDMVVKMGEEIVYFIEVKSRWDKNTTIKMSTRQINQSVDSKNAYSLCCVDMSEYSNEDRYEVTDVSKISDKIKFITEIGHHIEPLISNARRAKEDEITLTDGYTANIHQEFVKKVGKSMEGFSNHLIDKLKLQ